MPFEDVSEGDDTYGSSAFVFQKSILDQVQFPGRSNIRHAALTAQSTTLIGLAKSKKSTYQWLTTVFSCLENQLKEMVQQGSSGTQPLTPSKAIGVPVRAPSTDQKTAQPADLVNHKKRFRKSSK
jgi:hypothetical protein